MIMTLCMAIICMHGHGHRCQFQEAQPSSSEMPFLYPAGALPKPSVLNLEPGWGGASNIDIKYAKLIHIIYQIDSLSMCSLRLAWEFTVSDTITC